MRRFLTCLLLIGCGGADSAGSAGSGGPAATDAGSGGTSGRVTAADGGKGGAGAGGSAVYGGGGAGTSAGGNGANAGAGGHTAALPSLSIVPNVIAGKQMTAASQNIGSSMFSQRVGTVSGTSLQSLKYYVTSIQLCEELELQGSGFSNPRGCVTLYENQGAGSPDYNHYMVTEAIADNTPGRYIDLMTAAGQATLRQPRTVQLPPRPEPQPNDADAGVEDVPGALAVFRYGLINFYRPIKVTAEFPIVGESGQYFRTKASTPFGRVEPSSTTFGSERVTVGDTLMGATEETTYMLNNGGALFTFQKPFVITQADVDAKTEMKIDLVFNPENFGQAYDGVVDCQSQMWVSICDPLNHVAIDMPFVRMSPVPRKHGERTRKETYLMDYEVNSRIRIELYYNDADPEAGVQGVDTAIVYGPGAPNMYNQNVVASNFVAQSGSVQTSDATLRLQDYRHLDSVTGLRRRQSGTATLHCLYAGGGSCATMGDVVSKAYTYEGDTIVSSD